MPDPEPVVYTVGDTPIVNAAPDPPSSPGAPVPAGPGPANASPASPAAATAVLGGAGVRIPVLP